LEFLREYLFKELLIKGNLNLKELSEVLNLNEKRLRDVIRPYSNFFEVRGSEVRIKDAVNLILALWKEGFRMDELLRYSNWRYFEELCCRLFSEASFHALRGLHFSYEGKRYEVDVVALRDPYVIVIDCKRWRRAMRSRVEVFANRHLERCKALAKELWHLKRLNALIGKWRTAKIVPILLTLLEESVKLVNGVAIVPLFKLRGFIKELPYLLEDLTVFESSRREGKLA